MSLVPRTGLELPRALRLTLFALVPALVAVVLMALAWAGVTREEGMPVHFSVAPRPPEAVEERPVEFADLLQLPEAPRREVRKGKAPDEVADAVAASVGGATCGAPILCGGTPIVDPVFGSFPDRDPGELVPLSANRPSGSRHAASERELALRAGLAWLRDQQACDGYWDDDDFMHSRSPGASCTCDLPGQKVPDVGITGFALLAFLGDGNTTRQGPYKEAVSRGIQWLREQQDKDTGRLGDGSGWDPLRDHAIATLAICEAYLFSKNPLIKTSAQAALDFLLPASDSERAWQRAQRPDGGRDAELKGWLLLVLESAESSGLEFDSDAGAAALEECLTGFDDRFASPRDDAGTAVALLARSLAGLPPHSQGGEDPLMDLYSASLSARGLAISRRDLGPELYFATRAMRRMGDERHWEPWRRALEDVLGPAQRHDSDAAGSWDPDGPWGRFGGRVHSTALALLTLEVHYRYARVIGPRESTEPQRELLRRR